MYEKRSYRDLFKGNNLKFFNICVFETDLSIGVCENICNSDDMSRPVQNCNLEDSVISSSSSGNSGNNAIENTIVYRTALRSVRKYRQQIQDYIRIQPEFLTSLEPVVPKPCCAPIIQKMCEAADKAQVGPMAAVAGAIAEMTGYALLRYSDEVIVENGGDIFIKTDSERKIGIYAGDSPLSGKLALKILPKQTPAGVCTSSGTVGHSLSFGKADAVVIVSKDTFLADAVATSVGNKVKTPKDIEYALNYASQIKGITGAVIIVRDKIGAWGDIELTKF